MLRKLFKVFAITSVLALFSVPALGQDVLDTMALYENLEGDFTWENLDDFADLGLEGTTVTIFGAFVDTDARRFVSAVAPFIAATGIDIVYEGSGDFEALVRVRVEGGDAPDIGAFPQPGLFADLSESVVPVSDTVAEIMNTNYDSGWVELSTVDGVLKAIVYRANVKSLVWYNPTQFAAAGYEVPTSWDELIALSDLIVEDGDTPWCIGIESSGATGWVITDWLEDVLLRTAPPETYDAWVTNSIPFDDPAIVNALNTVGEIVLNPDYVAGGTTAILTTPFGDSPGGLFTDPPSCYMHRQASFIPGFFPEGVSIAEDGDAWAFYLPGIDPEFGNPLLTAGDLYAAFSDRPEVNAVMEYLAGPLSQELWAAQGGFVAPNVTASLEVYPTPLDRLYAELLVTADVARFDASDLMPGAIGAGEFWSAMVQWIQGTSTEEALAQVQAVWSNLE